MNYKVIILDFDGVLVESNNIKHQAFSEIFSAYPEHSQAMMEYHYAHNHVHRRDKFKYFFEHILKQPYTVDDIEQMARRFSELTRRKIIECPYAPGAIEFLETFSLRLPLYIASATPLDELMIILRERGLEKYFKGIYGAPMPKINMFNEIIKREMILPYEVLFIGDSPEDERVAHEAGIQFLNGGSNGLFDKLVQSER